MKKFYSFILLLLLTVNIISCGYQLRGTDEIKFKSISKKLRVCLIPATVPSPTPTVPILSLAITVILWP